MISFAVDKNVGIASFIAMKYDSKTILVVNEESKQSVLYKYDYDCGICFWFNYKDGKKLSTPLVRRRN